MIDQHAIEDEIAFLRISAAELRALAARSGPEAAGELRLIAAKCDREADKLKEMPPQ